jgi:phage terminase small subunit
LSLTPKQELFAQEFVKLGNASEAYRIAYPKSLSWKSESVNENASRLNANSKVISRVKELQAQQEKKHEISKDKILTRLKEIIFEQELIGVDKLDLNAMNKAIDTINKMQGYYAPTKEETVLTETQTLPDWFNRK